MDRRDAMGLPGSASYYMSRGITGPGTQSALHGSPGIHPLSNPNVQFQSNMGTASIGPTITVEPSSEISSHGANMGGLSGGPSGEPMKRKRGRPRKYGTDGSVSLALSPTKSTHPGTITPTTQKRGRGRPPGSGRKQQLAPLGEALSGSAGIGFTPHIITVAIGEDIATKIMSFSQQGPRAICILSACGAVSTVTLCQPSTSGGTLTYEGRFEILCLSGSFLVSDNNAGSRNRTGGLSVSLASPDGRVIGGGVGGMLIAGSPVQVIMGSFIWGGSKTKNKKEEGSEGARDSDHQTVDDHHMTLNSVPSSQNVIPSSMGIWTSGRPMDMRNAHVDIDLMRG